MQSTSTRTAFDPETIRAEAGVTPTIVAPGHLGQEQAGTAWDLVRTAYLHNSLRIDERVALLCAALEREDTRASGAHATGITLAGQQERLVDVGQVWTEMQRTDRGRRLLHATIRLGQGKDVDPKVLNAVHNDLGPLTAAWQDILRFAAWIDIWHRSQGAQAHASSDARVDQWLGMLVEAEAALDDDIAHRVPE